MQVSGPFDGRKSRRKRCDRCVERRIKCIGGRPCHNCTRTNHLCQIAAKPEPAAWVFVHTKQIHSSHSACTPGERAAVSLPRQVSSVPSDIYLTYFFTSFLAQNAFTSVSEQFRTSLSSLLYCSRDLQDAINAISALHIAQNADIAAQGDYPAALDAYARSVQCLQAKITSGLIVRDPSALWTTLLLGVFELMRDATGTNWLAHFLHGTSTMLCLQGPEILLHSSRENQHYQAFFVSARIFEISRALIYTEPTFLAMPEWRAAVEVYWAQHQNAWTPKEALFDILPRFVDLAIRVLQFVTDDRNIPLQDRRNTATSLTEEGHTLRSTLSSWYSAFSSWPLVNTGGSRADAEMSIALVYYYTISIYLDGIFSYHAPFTIAPAPNAPVLERFVIEAYVENILNLSQEMLAQGCAGILLFFPLRVAGARAQDFETRLTILRVLRTISKRGFTVAQSFVADLSDLWGI